MVGLIDESFLAVKGKKETETSLLILRQENVAFDLLNRFKNTFQGITNDFKDIAKGIFSATYNSKNRTAGTNKDQFAAFRKNSVGLNMVTHSDMLLPCLDGFEKNWHGYIMDCERYRPVVTEALQALEDFDALLTKFISDKNAKLSLQDNKFVYTALTKKRESVEKVISTYFKSSVNQRQRLSKLFDSTSDMVESFDQSLASFKAVEGISLEALNNRVNEVSKKMDLVCEMATNNRTMEVSKQSLVNLAEGGYEAAKQVEFLAKYIARLETNMVVSGNMAQRLNEVLG